MKITKVILTGVLLLSAIWAQASLSYNPTFTSGGNIPVDNPAGLVSVGTITGAGALDQVVNLTVGLDISGGYNGNLFAYLIAPNGALVVLLDGPGVAANGFGASGSGMNIILSDAYTPQGNIQDVTSGGTLSGTYNPANALSSLDGSSVNGNWTLFFADQTSGGGTSSLNSWSLDITAVPEPVNVALAMFGLLAMVPFLFRLVKSAWSVSDN
jgi:subtilisin-like proprotein convertase family protein